MVFKNFGDDLPIPSVGLDRYLDIHQNIDAMQKVWKALSDPTRRKILELLRERDLSAGEIAEHFDTRWPTISHHLEVLKNSGLVTAHRQGQKIIYSLNLTVLDEVLAYIVELLEKEGRKNEE